MLHKEIPFLRIGLPLCAGIISGLYFTPDLIFLICSAILIISGFLFSRLFNKYITNRIFGITLTFSLFICGLILYTLEKQGISVLKPEKALFSCTLSDYPEEKGNSIRLIVKLCTRTSSHGNTESVSGSMLLYNKKDLQASNLLPGDILFISCIPVEIVNRGNPYEFDYRFFMQNQGIRYYAFTNNSDIIKHTSPSHRKLSYRALITREKIIDIFRSCGIKGERLALVSAITLGQKSMLDPEQKMNFVRAGVMHIMAVSGLHAIILSLFVLTVLFFMKKKFNVYRVIIAISVLWAFAFVTGLTPSVLRATMMFTFLQTGKLMRRPSNGINSVLASAFCLILIRPSVIFDAGFLLSYSAVIYIICFYQNFYLLISFKNWLSDKIWQSVAITIVAQAGTLPLTMMLFNRFPTYFILANVTIVPVSNLLIVTGCLVPIFFRIHFLSHYLAIILNYLTGFTEMLTARAASLPYSTIDNIGLTIPECILLTCTIFLFTYFLLKKKSIPIIYPMIFLVLFIVAGSARDIISKKTNELIIYNTPGYSTIGIRTGKIMNLYSDSAAGQEVKRHCAILGLKIKALPLRGKTYCIGEGKSRILITEAINNRIIKEYTPEITVITGSGSEIRDNLKFAPACETLIFSSAVKSVVAVPKSLAIDSIHFVRLSGAFVKRI